MDRSVPEKYSECYPERRSYEKATARLSRKLLRWYETVLSGLPEGCAGALAEFCIITAALFVLREKKLIADHTFLSDCGPSGPGCSCRSFISSLPLSVRKLELFSSFCLESLPRIDQQQREMLIDILSPSVPLLLQLEPSGEWLGRIFEVLLAGQYNKSIVLSSRKKTGSFYTPRQVVSYMVKEALIRYFSTCAQEKLWPLKESLFRRWITSSLSGNDRLLPPLEKYRSGLLDLLRQCRILDPSCGSGFFLLEAFRSMMCLWASLEKSDPLCREDLLRSRGEFLLQNVLYGIDIQQIPLRIAQFCCYLGFPAPEENGFLYFLPEKMHLYCCNAILDPPDGMENFFDIVIGNPPYVAIPSISPGERARYRANCSFARGRFNLFYLFLEKSRFWMKQNACSMWLVPDRVLLNTQCGFLRDFLLEKMDLFQWVSFEKPLFRSASVDPVILGYSRHAASSSGKVHQIPCRKNVSVEDLQRDSFCLLTPEELCFSCSSRNGSEERSFALRERIRKKSPLVLEDIVTIRDGIIQGPIGSSLFHQGPLQKCSPPPEECGKLLFGRNITPYRIHFQENYVHYNIPLMKELERKSSSGTASSLRMRKKEIFLVRKILSRQTADGIIAALDEKGEYFYANTLHGSVLVPSCGCDLYFVLGFMNSRLATFLYRSQSMEQGKSFAQIKIALLKKLPVPSMGKKEQEQISSLVRKILALSPDAEQRIFTHLCSQIDTLIYIFYDLTPEEISLVESAPSSVTENREH